MPNRGVHTVAGVGTAVVIGLALAPNDMESDDRLLFGLGLALGGWLGARMPDLLDPPTSPGHRSFAHGLIPIVSLVAGEWMKWVGFCRSRVAELREEAGRCIDIEEAKRKRCAAGWWMLAAGAVQGFGLGYASHLVLDACTTRSLPLLG